MNWDFCRNFSVPLCLCGGLLLAFNCHDRNVIIDTLSGSNSVVECDLAKVEVAGSNPVSRSRSSLPGAVPRF